MRSPGLEDLPMWVVYEKPPEFPDNFVARLWVWDEPTKAYVLNPHELMVAPDVDLIRQQLWTQGFIKLDRHAEDDPRIVETWI